MKKLRLAIVIVMVFVFTLTLCSCSTAHYLVNEGVYAYGGNNFVLGGQIVEKFEMEFVSINEKTYEQAQGVNALRISNPNRGARSGIPFSSKAEDWCFSLSLKIQVYRGNLTQYDVVFEKIDDLNFSVVGQNEFAEDFGVSGFKLRFKDNEIVKIGSGWKQYSAKAISVDLSNTYKDKFTESFELRYVAPNDK